MRWKLIRIRARVQRFSLLRFRGRLMLLSKERLL